MDRFQAIDGRVIQDEAPDWAPLRAVVDGSLVEWFMWMYEVRLGDGSPLHAYKHVTTRRYLHLTADGRAFDYRDGRFGRIALASSIVRAFAGWERALPPPRQTRAVRAAVAAARGAAT